MLVFVAESKGMAMGHQGDDQHGLHAADDGAEHGHQHGTRADGRGSAGLRRIELITGQERRRRWSPEEKATITAQSFVPGANVAHVARRNGVSAGLLHYWRRCAREEASEVVMRFVPVMEAAAPGLAAPPSGVEPSIVIAFGDLRVHLVGTVDGDALRTVMAALRASA